MLALIKNIGKIDGVNVDTFDFTINPSFQTISFTWLDFGYSIHIEDAGIEIQKADNHLTSIYWSPKDGKLHNGAAKLSKVDRMLIDQLTKIIWNMNDTDKRCRIVIGDVKVSYNGYEITIEGPHVVATKKVPGGYIDTQVLYKSIWGEISDVFICGDFYYVAKFVRDNFMKEVK